VQLLVLAATIAARIEVLPTAKEKIAKSRRLATAPCNTKKGSLFKNRIS
jgi:hypothetical protein